MRNLRSLFVFIIATLLIAITVFLNPELKNTTSVSAQSDSSQIARRSPEENLTIDVYKNTHEAVVFISTVTLTVDPFDFFHEIKPQAGSGSGIIVDAKQGIIVTNLHVIQDAHQISILISDSPPLKAKLLGYDQEYDLAVLQLVKVPENLQAIRFGDSANLEVGQKVLAIGNPFGLNRTLTTGIISSLHRTVRNPSGGLMRELIQTDAAINPGNSGGPLLDSEGRLIGINTAILSQSGDSAGIGFAVPINQIKRILPELIQNGKILKPYFGWVLVDTSTGPMVRRVIAGGPAEQAGFQGIERMVSNVFVKGYVRDFGKADILLTCNGNMIRNVEELDELISKATDKSQFVFTVRNPHSKEIRSITLKTEMR